VTHETRNEVEAACFSRKASEKLSRACWDALERWKHLEKS